jgi:hypothetical protein
MRKSRHEREDGADAPATDRFRVMRPAERRRLPLRVLIRRILLSAAGLLFAFFAWRDVAVTYWLSTLPDNAPEFLQSDIGFVQAGVEGALRTGKPIEPDDIRDVIGVSKARLAQEPLDATAMRQIGLGDRMLGKPRFVDTLKLAERISRRDFHTELALVGVASARGDYAGALRHIDAAVMVRHDSRDILFPAMAGTLPDPGFRKAILGYSRRTWFPAFLARALRERPPEIPANIAALLLDRRASLAKKDVIAIQPLAWRLAANRDLSTARAVAAKFGPVPRTALENFAITQQSANELFAPVTWRLISDGTVQTKLSGNMIQVEAEPGAAVVFAERMTQLSPGRYAIAQRAGGDGATGIRLEWDMTCGTVGIDLPITWRGNVPIGETPVPGRSEMIVMPDCPLQIWRLMLLVDDRQVPVRFAVGDFDLRQVPLRALP